MLVVDGVEWGDGDGYVRVGAAAESAGSVTWNRSRWKRWRSAAGGREPFRS